MTITVFAASKSKLVYKLEYKMVKHKTIVSTQLTNEDKLDEITDIICPLLSIENTNGDETFKGNQIVLGQQWK